MAQSSAGAAGVLSGVNQQASIAGSSGQDRLPGFSIPVGIVTPEMAQSSAGAAGVLSGINQQASIAGSSRMG
jgi:hypothetical protein